MRIAQVTATFPPYLGGTGLVSFYQTRELAKRGHTVTVYTAGRTGMPSDNDLPRVTVHHLRPLFQMGNAPFLPGLLALADADVIHLHHPFIFGAEMVRAISQLRGIPYVLTHHNDLIGVGARRHLFNIYSALSSSLVFSGARKYAAISLDHALSCRMAPLFRARRDDVFEVPNGVDVDSFRPGLDGGSIRRNHGVPEGAAVVMFVGALDRAHSFKGVTHLVEAFSRLAERRTVLVIVGDGELRADFSRLTVRLGVADRVCFACAVPHTQLPPYYAAADVLVLPSYPPESFGLVLLEAMACGKPVIASNLPGVRKVVSDGQDGLLVRPADADDLVEKIGMLLDDPQRRREMGERGRAKVEAKYAWPKVIDKLEAVYDLVLEEGARA